MYQYGDIICSAVDSEGGKYRARVEVSGLKLSPPQAEPHIYLSEKRFSSVSDALHHAIDYIEERFPAGGPPYSTATGAA